MEEEGWSGCCTGRASSRVWMRSQPVAGAEVPEVLAAMLEVLAAVPAMSKRAPSEVGSADMCCVRFAAGRGSTKNKFAGSSSVAATAACGGRGRGGCVGCKRRRLAWRARHVGVCVVAVVGKLRSRARLLPVPMKHGAAFGHGNGYAVDEFPHRLGGDGTHAAT